MSRHTIRLLSSSTFVYIKKDGQIKLHASLQLSSKDLNWPHILYAQLIYSTFIKIIYTHEQNPERL